MEILKQGTPVYITKSGSVVESRVTKFPGKDRDYYRVYDLDFPLSSKINEWPEYVFLDKEKAQEDAELRRRKRDSELVEWVNIAAASPEVLLFNMFRIWKAARFTIRETFGEALLSTRPELKWKEEQIRAKIREYFGVDIEKE